MIDVSELAAVPVRSGAPEEDLVRVARPAADIRLGPGEHAVHEGDDRALFLVLAGKIEVRKAIDGIERTIGWRSPGQIFGEVPIIFGISFQGSFRAHEPSRVIRIDPAQFHTLAARFPDALTRLAALARERIGGGGENSRCVAVLDERKRAGNDLADRRMRVTDTGRREL